MRRRIVARTRNVVRGSISECKIFRCLSRDVMANELTIPNRAILMRLLLSIERIAELPVEVMLRILGLLRAELYDYRVRRGDQ